MAQIIGLFERKPAGRDWSNQDLAELYRVEASLVQAGLNIDTERGKSDEGDPWFVFCHGENGTVIVHFAYMDGQYVIVAPSLNRALVGRELGTIVRQFIAENPVSLPAPSSERSSSNVIVHPAALLTVFVATILMLSASGDGHAASFGEDGSAGAGTAGFGPSGLVCMPDTEASGESGSVGAWHGDETLQSGDEQPRLGEKTLFLAALALAVEVARIKGQTNSEPVVAAPNLLDGLLGDTDAADGGKEAQDLHAGLFGLSMSEAFALAERLPGEQIALIEADTLPVIDLAATMIPHTSFEGQTITVPRQMDAAAAQDPAVRQPAGPAADTMAGQAEEQQPVSHANGGRIVEGENGVSSALIATSESVEAPPPATSLAAPQETPQPAPQAATSNAIAWFETWFDDNFSTTQTTFPAESLEVTAESIDSIDAIELAGGIGDSVEKDTGHEVDTTGYEPMLPDPTDKVIDDTQMVSTASAAIVEEDATPAVSGVPNVRLQLRNQDNQEMKQAIDYFRASDDDIKMEYIGNDSIVIFDRSDLSDEENLAWHRWEFDDGSTIVMMGNADTVHDALYFTS